MSLTRITDKQVTYKQGATDSVVRNMGDKLREVVSVLDFGAYNDGTHPEETTAAFEAAITYCQANHKTLYIPSVEPSQAYAIKRPLEITSEMDMVGDSPLGVTLAATDDLLAGEYVLSITHPTKLTGMRFSNITLQGNDVCNCLYVNNVTSSTFENINVRTAVHGVVFDGSAANNYQMTWTNLNCLTEITGNTVRVINSLVNTSFIGCYFGGNTGLYVAATAGFNANSLVGCNFEGCTNHAIDVLGGIQGLSITGCRCEANLSLVADFMFEPQGSASCSGISITGCYFSRGNAPSVIRFDGAVSGFQVTGNFCRQGYTQWVYCNGGGDAGHISGNYSQYAGTYPTYGNPINAERSGVTSLNNSHRNLTGGALQLIKGMYEEGTFTPTVSSGITSPTYSQQYGTYTRIGKTVLFQFRLRMSGGSSSGGQLVVTGLPYASADSPSGNGTASVGYNGMNTASALVIIAENTTNVAFYNLDLSNYTVSTVGTSYLMVSGQYQIA